MSQDEEQLYDKDQDDPIFSYYHDKLKNEEETKFKPEKGEIDLSQNTVHQQYTKKYVNFTIDLHGFTRYAAKNCVIRAIQSMNLNEASYKITFITGVGNHSINESVLDKIVKEVADSFSMKLVKDDQNLGRTYLITEMISKQSKTPNKFKSRQPHTTKR